LRLRSAVKLCSVVKRVERVCLSKEIKGVKEVGLGETVKCDIVEDVVEGKTRRAD
jgi:hypothetical protein